MGFLLLPKSVTLKGAIIAMAVTLRHFTKVIAFGAIYIKLTEARPTVSAAKCSRKILVFGTCHS